MANAKRTITLSLNAETTGSDSVKELAAEVEKLAKSGGDAAPEFDRLAKELAQLGQQKAVVENFTALDRALTDAKQASNEATAELSKQADTLRQLDKELADATAREKAFAETIDKANRAKSEANTQYKEAKAAVSAYKAEIGDARKATDEQRATLGQLEDVVRKSKAGWDETVAVLSKLNPEYTRLKKETKEAGAAFSEQEKVLRKSSSEATKVTSTFGELADAMEEIVTEANALGVNLDDIAGTQNKLTQAIGKSTSEFDDLKKAVADAEEQTGGLTRAQVEAAAAAAAAAEKTRILADALAAADRAAAELKARKIHEEQHQAALSAQQAAEYTKWWADALEEVSRAEAAAKVQADSLRDAMDTLGLSGSSSADKLRAEILKINQALIRLAGDSNITGEEFDRAFANAQQRIAELEAQLNGAENAAKGFGGAFKNALRQFGPATIVFNGVSAAITAITTAARDIPRVVAEFESLERTLRVITGSAEAAAKEFEFLRGVASRTGQGVVELSRAYGSLAASTQGTALAGAQTRRVFESVAYAMGVLGKSAADTELALQAIQQMVSKGVVSMEEFRQQLGERLPGVLQETAKAMKITTAELNALIAAGKLTAEELFGPMSEGVENLYGYAGKNDTLIGDWNRFKNAIKETSNAIGGDTGLVKNMLGLVRLVATVVAGIAGLVGTMYTAIKAVVQFVTGFKTLKEAFNDILGSGNKLLKNLKDMSGLFPIAAKSIREQAEAAKKAGQETFKLADGTEVATAAIVGQTDSMIAYKVEMQKKQDAAATDIKIQRELAERTRATGELLITTANALGDETDKRRVATEVALDNAAAQEVLVEKTRALLALQIEEAKAIAENIRLSDNDNANDKLLLESLTKQIEGRKAALEALDNQAKASRVLADALNIESQAAQDNSLRVDQLRSDYLELTSSLDTLRVALAEGAISQEQFNAVEERAMQVKRLYTDAIDDENFALQALAKISGDENMAREASISALQRQMEMLRASGQARSDMYAKMQLELVQLETEKLALQDNSGAVDQLRAAYENAKLAVEELTAAKAQGKDVDAELIQANLALAQSAALYKDALSDKITAINLANQATQDQYSAEVTLLGAQIDVLRVSAQLATAKGNEGEASRILRQIKVLEAQQSAIVARAKLEEARATLALAEASRAELIASGNATQAQIKAANAAITAAKAKVSAAQSAIRLLSELKKLNAELDRTAGKADKAADSFNELADAKDKAAAAGGEGSGGGGVQRRERRSAPGQSGTQLARQSGRFNVELGDEDAFDDAFAAMYNKLVQEMKFKPGTSRDTYIKAMQRAEVSAMAYAAEQVKKASEEAVDHVTQSGTNTTSRASSGGASGSSVPQGRAPVAATYNVNVKLGNTTTPIKTATNADAQNLTNLLKQLETAAGRAS